MSAASNSSCRWCGLPVFGRGEFGLVKARRYGGEGAWAARFHVRCAAAVLAVCEDHARAAAIAAAEAAKPKPVRARRGPARRKAMPAPEIAPPPRDAAAPVAEILVLASRGVPANQIAARLRAPYAAVRAILEAA